MTEYLEQKLLTANPFDTLDVEGVGQLVRMGCRARPRDAARPQARHLRRARRRSRLGRVLPRGRARLRVVLAVPRADRPARRRARRARKRRTGHHRLTASASPSEVGTRARSAANSHQNHVERQNSLPSGSASTTHSADGPVVAAPRAPSSTRRRGLRGEVVAPQVEVHPVLHRLRLRDELKAQRGSTPGASTSTPGSSSTSSMPMLRSRSISASS